jgi:ecotin
MKKQIFLISILAMALLGASCGNRKADPAIETGPESISNSPRVTGYVPHTFLLNSEEDESLFKVEVIPGIEMEIDCNQHSLVGEFEERTLEDDQTYLFFNSNGMIFSTQMACLDNRRHKAFVTAQSHLVRYNSAVPLVVYRPDAAGIELRHRIWQAGETYPITLALAAIYNAATRALVAFPTEKDGYQRFVLMLPEVTDTSKELKVEMIPGKIEEVDCNRHILIGTFSKETVDGWGYDYLVFSSDGIMAATRMACVDPARPEFVSGPTEFIRYNSELPIVVFAPEGFEVRFRIWEAPSM